MKERIYGIGAGPAWGEYHPNFVDVYMKPTSDGAYTIYIKGREDDALWVSSTDALPNYLKYALATRVKYRFRVGNISDKLGCVMSVPREEAENIFRSS